MEGFKGLSELERAAAKDSRTAEERFGQKAKYRDMSVPTLSNIARALLIDQDTLDKAGDEVAESEGGRYEAREAVITLLFQPHITEFDRLSAAGMDRPGIETVLAGVLGASDAPLDQFLVGAKLAKYKEQLTMMGVITLDQIKDISEQDWGDCSPGLGPFKFGWKRPDIRRLRQQLSKRPEYAATYKAHLRRITSVAASAPAAGAASLADAISPLDHELGTRLEAANLAGKLNVPTMLSSKEGQDPGTFQTLVDRIGSFCSIDKKELLEAHKVDVANEAAKGRSKEEKQQVLQQSWRIHALARALDEQKQCGRAMELYQRAWADGCPGSARFIARIYRERNQPELAFDWALKGALSEDIVAEVDTGVHLLNGDGVPRNVPAGLKFLLGAAKRASPEALEKLMVFKQACKHSLPAALKNFQDQCTANGWTLAELTAAADKAGVKGTNADALDSLAKGRERWGGKAPPAVPNLGGPQSQRQIGGGKKKGKKKGKRKPTNNVSRQSMPEVEEDETAGAAGSGAAEEEPKRMQAAGWEGQLSCIMEWAGAEAKQARAVAARLVERGCDGPEALRQTQKDELLESGLGEYEAVFLICSGNAGAAAEEVAVPTPALEELEKRVQEDEEVELAAALRSWDSCTTDEERTSVGLESLKAACAAKGLEEKSGMTAKSDAARMKALRSLLVAFDLDRSMFYTAADAAAEKSAAAAAAAAAAQSGGLPEPEVESGPSGGVTGGVPVGLTEFLNMPGFQGIMELQLDANGEVVSKPVSSAAATAVLAQASEAAVIASKADRDQELSRVESLIKSIPHIHRPTSASEYSQASAVQEQELDRIQKQLHSGQLASKSKVAKIDLAELKIELGETSVKGLRERAKEYGATKQDLAEAARRPAKDQQAFLIPLILQNVANFQMLCKMTDEMFPPGTPGSAPADNEPILPLDTPSPPEAAQYRPAAAATQPKKNRKQRRQEQMVKEAAAAKQAAKQEEAAVEPEAAGGDHEEEEEEEAEFFDTQGEQNEVAMDPPPLPAAIPAAVPDVDSDSDDSARSARAAGLPHRHTAHGRDRGRRDRLQQAIESLAAAESPALAASGSAGGPNRPLESLVAAEVSVLLTNRDYKVLIGPFAADEIDGCAMPDIDDEYLQECGMKARPKRKAFLRMVATLLKDGVSVKLLAAEVESGAAGVARLLREVPVAFPVQAAFPVAEGGAEGGAEGEEVQADGVDDDELSEPGDYLDVS